MDELNAEGETALIVAVQKNNIDMVKELLRLGADTTIPNSKGQTALILAIIKQNKELVDTLLDSEQIKINEQDAFEGNTPLMYAIKTQNINIIKAILDKLPDPYAKTWKSNKTAKDFALAIPDKKLKNEIIKNLEDEENQFNLFNAIAHKNLTEIQLFLTQKHVNVNQVLKSGLTPLLFAVYRGEPEIVDLLLKYGADPNVQRNKLTALNIVEAILLKPTSDKKAYETIKKLLETKIKTIQPSLLIHIQNLTQALKSVAQKLK